MESLHNYYGVRIMENVIIYIHGKGGCAEESLHYIGDCSVTGRL